MCFSSSISVFFSGITCHSLPGQFCSVSVWLCGMSRGFGKIPGSPFCRVFLLNGVFVYRKDGIVLVSFFWKI